MTISGTLKKNVPRESLMAILRRQVLAKNEGFEFVLSERIGPCRQPIGSRRPASRVGAGRRLAKRAVDD